MHVLCMKVYHDFAFCMEGWVMVRLSNCYEMVVFQQPQCRWRLLANLIVKINFDTAYDKNRQKSVLGIPI